MADIEALCNRLVLIDDGRILHDGPLADFKQRFMSKRIVAFETDKVRDGVGLRLLLKKARKIEKEGRWTRLHLENDAAVPEVVKELFSVCDVHDLIVHEPTLESVIREVCRGQYPKKDGLEQ